MLQALVSLSLLSYVHYAFTRQPINCLKHHLAMNTARHDDAVWLRDDILRVEVIRNAALLSNYSLLDSYAKEFTADMLYDDGEAVPTTVHSASHS